MLPHAVARDNQYIVQALERQWILDHSQNLEALWEAMSSADFADERIPYWTELWPASLGLAEWLSCRRAEIAGQPCLDLGCGIGFTAMIGQYLGAKTIACDYEQAALAAALANCRRNDCPMPRFLAMDWRKPALARGSMARIWAGDILYDKRAMQPVLKIIGHLLAMDGKAWIAEPGRTIFGQFTDMAREAGWEIARARTLRVAAIEPPGRMLNIGIWELWRTRP